ncbi:ZYRO0F18128p [Zygosaccharomyces rouxii]|uniref:ZYRO0F18128p n=2 Tax=Zygosaccharomyces rouxii TaxID=4956 RepID=C5DZ46_ZYGRC|nr:uncharacterized protein ZYRO0F18128g [Zygosaccharomyces rouxii]KAH9201232.1 protein DCG1 [Zygosaccharomyces rouxii]CAQ43318.1 Protein DCG1 [Zygosaccharomyces rouxii]CAR29057.1 ZYRO0F18128p [Zygosaccharomyces rouxii]
MKILVINPNSSESMTRSVAEALGGNCNANGINYDVVFATGPKDSPPEINDERTAVQSAESCWKVLGDSRNPLHYANYQGIVIACFSDHPLVKMIQQQESGPPVCSLLRPSVFYLDLFGGGAGGNKPPFSIITSSKEWVEPLDLSLHRMVAPEQRSSWRPTVAAQVNPLGLSGEADHVARVIRDENYGEYGSKTVILGCAGYCGIRDQLQSLVPSEVTLIEPCKVAVEFVVAAAKINDREVCKVGDLQ